MTVIRRSHAYRDGSMVAECGYPRRPREPMDARKPTCPVCLKIERQRSQLEGVVGQIDEALKLLEARRAPGGQIPLAAESADRVLALLRAAATGGQ